MHQKIAALLLATLPAWSLAADTTHDPALKPPRINTAPGPEYAENTRLFQGIPGIERAANGRLWATWYAGGPDEPGEGPGNYVVLVTSADDGASWSKAKLVIDPAGPVRAYDPCLWHAPDGRLWLFWAQSYSWWDGRSGVWCIVTENSGNEAPRWSVPRRLCNGIMMNKPTVLSSGEWLLPASVWAQPADPRTPPDRRHNLGSENGANVHVSRDKGATWSLLGQAEVPKRVFDEHSVIERGDGSLWMLVRAAYGIGESESTDRGKTWCAGKPSPIPHVNSRFFIKRLQSGKLLLVTHNPPDKKGRSHLIAQLSDDDGKTWAGGLMIDERPGVSYPDGVQAPDGTVFIIYDYSRTGQKQIFMAAFTEDDVRQGRWQSAKARQRVLVNQAKGETLKPGASARATKVETGKWLTQAADDAKQDRSTIAYDGKSPNKLVCDTTLRELADGSWALFMLAGDDFEPSPKNFIGLTRSSDQGRTWSPLQPIGIGMPREGKTSGQGPTELMVRGDRNTLFFSTHSQTWGRDWKSWMMRSDDLCRTWSKPEPLPGRLANFTFIRNHIVTRDGRIVVPFQHYVGPGPDLPPPPAEGKPWHKALRHYVSNPRNGVLISSDDGKTWSEHGNIRLTDDDRYHGWAENNIAELADGRIAMIIRGDRLGGVLYYAESKDGGTTWPEFARKTEIPNPGSKATLYPLGGDTVAMLHNPDPKRRSPLALWISFDGLKTWPYQRVLVPESSDGPKGNLNYPDGFVSRDKQWLHFAFDDNRHRAVHYSAKLPALPGATAPEAVKAAKTNMTPPVEVLDLTLEPTVINTEPGPEYSDEQRDYAMTIGIESTRGGRLWAAWVAGGDSPLAYFVAASSDDDGATWSKPRLVIDPVDAPGGLPQSALVGNFWTDPTGKLWLFYDQSLGMFDGRAGVWATTCDNPDADEPKWSAPRRLWHGMTLNKPTVLNNGEWLLPISLWTRDRIGKEFRDCYPELDPLRMANIFVSTDQGATWTRRGGVKVPKTDFDEHMFVELNDGRLWLLARTTSGIAESFSSDQGRTWSEAKVSTIQNVSARFFLRRLTSGRLLLVKNGPLDQRLKSRAQMTAFLSDDEGKTWKGGLILDERDGVSYPDGFQAPDGRIVVSYDRNRAKDREILMAQFREEDVLAARLVSPGSRLKRLVNKALGPNLGTPP